MVIGAVLALWATTLAVADENCLLQGTRPAQLQVEESTMADVVSDQPIACPEGFADFSYNWTGVPGFPNGGPLSNGQEIGPNIELVSFDPTSPCIGAAIWNITNNDPSSPGADADLKTCPNNDQNSEPFCNILVVQSEGPTAGKVSDCNPSSDFAQINLQFTEPITLIALNFWDIESNNDLQIFYNTDGTEENQFAPDTGGVDGKGTQLFFNKVKVTTWSLRFRASGGVNGVRYCGTTTTTTPGGDVTGDPHIRTLDGNHYTLLNQGSFSLWRFSQGSDVDWQIYSHYSGHQSFTKGLLLVDQSASRFRQALELTAKDCRWRARTEGNEWEVVQQPQLFTAFNLTRHHVRFYMNSKRDEHDGHDGHDGHREVAVLSFRCRPSKFMNVAIKMRRAEDVKFVEGELRAARKPRGTSMLQMTDSEFEQHKSWTALGGSGVASTYLEATDEAAPSFVSQCQESQKADAAQICAKHLGEKMQRETGANADLFNDCVYDVCMGAGEVAAELAAELLASSKEVM